MVHLLIIMAGVVVALILIFRFTTHFHFCRRVSKKYPGEDLKGCPAWTLEEAGTERDNKEDRQKESGDR